MARVLVVEDDTDILNMIANVLRKHDYDVVATNSGPRALETIERLGPPDVAVLDVMMAGMSGFSLLRTLRAQDGTAELPAIFLSARSQAEDIATGERLGATYLTKPFRGRDLAAAIGRALAGE